MSAELLNQEIPRHEAVQELLTRAALAHGVGTADDIADYYRIAKTYAFGILRELADEGTLIPVTVKGWQRGGKPLPAYLHPEARIPRRIETVALLSPFDPVVWYRERALRMFDFHYRIEIYTPAPKRIYGYYTLPLLIDDRIVGRIDLKSDRQNRVLRVQSAWREPDAVGAGTRTRTGTDTGTGTDVEARTAQLLRETAAWQGLDAIEVMNWGDLAAGLAAELKVTVLPRT
jgi:uncharacterized protein YcaQ